MEFLNIKLPCFYTHFCYKSCIFKKNDAMKDKVKNSNACGGGALYGLGFIGAAIYFIQAAFPPG